MAFELDTSGSVGPMPGWEKPVPTCDRFIFWEKLDPLTQGYAEAQLREVFEWGTLADGKPYGFRHFAPETLATMMADCAAWRKAYCKVGDTPKDGAKFWELRQLQLVHRPDFPPLTLYLSDDGKIMARAA